MRLRKFWGILSDSSRIAISSSRRVNKGNELAEWVVRMSPKYTGSDLGQDSILTIPYAVFFQIQESSSQDKL
ncbi:hypothetical protein TNCV_371671 [Trichonephila clavipes]|nr:hypothetical protein TNCV_371671 [Trichonephila clavipes]